MNDVSLRPGDCCQCPKDNGKNCNSRLMYVGLYISGSKVFNELAIVYLELFSDQNEMSESIVEINIYIQLLYIHCQLYPETRLRCLWGGGPSA